MKIIKRICVLILQDISKCILKVVKKSYKMLFVLIVLPTLGLLSFPLAYYLLDEVYPNIDYLSLVIEQEFVGDSPSYSEFFLGLKEMRNDVSSFLVYLLFLFCIGIIGVLFSLYAILLWFLPPLIIVGGAILLILLLKVIKKHVLYPLIFYLEDLKDRLKEDQD